MSQAQLSTVDFHGNSLSLIEHQSEPFTPMRPIVEGMGLAWGAQQQKLSANKERWGVLIFDIPTVSGTQAMVCMPVRKLPAFFASISANKVRADIRATIILFQTECDDALWKYWTGRQVQFQAPALDTTSRLSTVADTERKALNKLVKVWGGILGGHQGETMPRCNTQVAAHFGKTTVDEMTVEEIRAAIAWVQGKIDGLQVPVVALPAAMPVDDKYEVYWSTIKAYIRSIKEQEREILAEAVKDMKPALRDISGPRRSIAIQAHTAMEKLFYSLDNGLEAAEATVRTALIASRM